MSQQQPYFTTRDLLMMATLAALGGVVGTYINTVGDFFQAIFGFAGSTQWAAGLHVLWITLAVGLTCKQGAGTITGILKGGVELLTGNTHGLLVLLVDIVSGLLVDLGFLPFRKKDSVAAFCLAGGLASASNVFVFQMFASVPVDSLAYIAMLLVASAAALSGVLFAGVLGRGLLSTLRRAGVVKDALPSQMGRQDYALFILTAVLLIIGLTFYLQSAFHGSSEVSIMGAVHFPFDYPSEYSNQDGSNTPIQSYRIPLRELLDQAHPDPDASLFLVKATDGYAFFISMNELRDNDALMLSPQGVGSDISYNIDGALNSKALVRGVKEIIVIGEKTLDISGALDAATPFNPNDWQYDMDSVRIDLGDGPRKLQGVPLGKVLSSLQPQIGSEFVVFYSDDEPLTLSLDDVMSDDEIRLFTVIGDRGVSFALARMQGDVLVAHVTRIEIQ